MTQPTPLGAARIIGIGDMAELSGASLRALRLYEAEGLIRARRDRLNARFYDAAGRERVLLVVRLRQMGLSLREIRELLVLHDAGEPIQAHLRRRLEARVEQLDRARAGLVDLLASLDHRDPLRASA